MAFVRARCEETGHIAALPEDALQMGMIPGWVAVDGPVPSGPKVAAFPDQYKDESNEDTSGDGQSEDDADTGEQPPPEEADTTSAKKNRG
ncbi:hypothetical protein ACIBCH_09905 [Amycolatopsis thailandensis]|uniref:hypothetical protein n=1 Tax=Amycolatopsis thailandensis TaxID=589330 RepID=UPI0037AD1B32